MAELSLSAATRVVLENQTLSNMGTYIDMVDKVRTAIQMMNNVDKYIEEQGHQQPREYSHLRRLSECSLLVGLIWLDITTAFRIYLNAKERYEAIYAVKQLTITINEGFKKIYNYTSLDENGNLKTRERSHSFWVKDIGTIVRGELPHLLPRYEQITVSLDAYDDRELKDMKGPRDLFIHFDKVPSLVYDELQKQDIERITIKTIPFMNILTEIIKFNKLVLDDYNTLITTGKNDMLDAHFQRFEKLKTVVGKNPEALDLLEKIQDFIRYSGQK